MSKDKYSVLLMRDDTRVKRFRISPFWLKLFLYFILLLLVLAGGGFYAGYMFWEKNEQLAQERVALERRQRELEVELERLQNVEKILQSNDAEEMQALFGSLTIEQEKQKEKPPLDLAKLFKRVDLEQVDVGKLTAKQVGSNSVRLTFDINNVDQNEALSGQVELSLLTREGQPADVDVNKADLSFQIQRFKKIVTTFSLPDGSALADFFALRMTIINAAGKTIFSDTYPLSQILS